MRSASFSQDVLNQKIKETLDKHVWGTVGPESKEAARSFAALLGRDAALFCSYHAGAAETVLRALELCHGDEVILPAVCSPFLKEAVEAVGAKPVFCEVDETLTMRAENLAFCRTDKTQAVFCEQSLGYVCNMPEIRRFTKEHDLPLIDVTSSPYATRFDDKPTAEYADIVLAALPVQNTGVLVTDEEFIGKLYAAHHCGNPYGHPGGLNTGVCLGGDMRIDEFRPTIIRYLITAADERRRQSNSLRIRISEALLQNGAELIPVREGADSSGEYILCRTSGKESCRDKAIRIPLRAYTEQGRIALSNAVAYTTL